MTSVTIDDFINNINAVGQKQGGKCTPVKRLKYLAGEVIELANADSRENTLEEAADVIWNAVAYAVESGFTCEEIAEGLRKKLNNNLERAWTQR